MNYTQLNSNPTRDSLSGQDVFIAKLWCSLKYEEVKMKAYESVKEARESIKTYLAFYNSERTHQSLDRQPPDVAYFQKPRADMAA